MSVITGCGSDSSEATQQGERMTCHQYKGITSWCLRTPLFWWGTEWLCMKHLLLKQASELVKMARAYA